MWLELNSLPAALCTNRLAKASFDASETADDMMMDAILQSTWLVSGEAEREPGPIPNQPAFISPSCPHHRGQD